MSTVTEQFTLHTQPDSCLRPPIQRFSTPRKTPCTTSPGPLPEVVVEGNHAHSDFYIILLGGINSLKALCRVDPPCLCSLSKKFALNCLIIHGRSQTPRGVVNGPRKGGDTSFGDRKRRMSSPKWPNRGSVKLVNCPFCVFLLQFFRVASDFRPQGGGSALP